MDKSVVILGAGGHGKVIADIVLKNGDKVIGFLDDQQKEKSLLGMPILGKVSKISEFPKDIEFILAIGSNETRKFLAEKYRVKWYTGVHPSAQIGLGAIVGEGTVIMANAVINPAAIIGKHCIINTGAVVEHDNVLENYVHVSPNATLCGNVYIGECTHIGAGATVKNQIKICSNTVVGAGGTVVMNLDKSGTYVGVPARLVKD